MAYIISFLLYIYTYEDGFDIYAEMNMSNNQPTNKRKIFSSCLIINSFFGFPGLHPQEKLYINYIIIFSLNELIIY